MKENDEIYMDLDMECLLRWFYGTRYASGISGWKDLSRYKKHLLKLTDTLTKVVERNVFGDDAHREHLLERCKDVKNEIQGAKSIKTMQASLICHLFEILFQTIGYIPTNFDLHSPNYRTLYNFQRHRTFNYTRSDYQKTRKLLDDAYHRRLGETAPTFAFLIDKWRYEMNEDSKGFLDWFAREHHDLWWRHVR